MKTELVESHIETIKKANATIDKVLAKHDQIAGYLNTVNDLTPGDKIILHRKQWRTFAQKRHWDFQESVCYFVSLGITRFGNIKLKVARKKDLAVTHTFYHDQWDKIVRVSDDVEIVP